MLLESFRLWINRDKRPVRTVIRRGGYDPRVMHLPTVQVLSHAARKRNRLASYKPVHKIGLIEPDGAQKARCIGDQYAKDRSSFGKLFEFHFLNDPHDTLRPVGFELRDRAEIAQVLVVAGKEKQRVGNGPDPQPLELWTQPLCRRRHIGQTGCQRCRGVFDARTPVMARLG
jgi:hypothetical protein